MPHLTALYVDFQSRPSYRAWRWLGVVGLADDVEVRPYSLDAGETGPWDAASGGPGLDLLVLGELAREQGRDVHHRFCDAAFAVVHDDGTARTRESWLAAAATAGLDLSTFDAEIDRLCAEVGLWHREAVDELGIRCVPALVFDDNLAMFVRLSSDVTDREAGRRLLLDIADLADQPILEIRRTAQ